MPNGQKFLRHISQNLGFQKLDAAARSIFEKVSFLRHIFVSFLGGLKSALKLNIATKFFQFLRHKKLEKFCRGVKF